MLPHPPTWFDWIVVLSAMLFSPVLAVFAQRVVDRLREKKDRRVRCYQTLMSTRANPLHPDQVTALNSIDAIFDRERGKDARVREAWGRVLAHVSTDANAPGWHERFLDLRVDLYQAVGKAVGYDHSVEYLKTRIYAPQHYETTEMEVTAIRQGLAAALGDGRLKVEIGEERGHQEAAAP